MENFEPKHMIFDHGTRGDKFYIILKGKVSIWIPKNEKYEDFSNKLLKEKMSLYAKRLLSNARSKINSKVIDSKQNKNQISLKN